MPKNKGVRSQHFLKEIEQAIQIANREMLSDRIPAITKDSIMPLAISVARLRAVYLAEAFSLAGDGQGQTLSEAEVESLKHHREMYEEARLAFESLTHIIDRGYIALDE